MRPFRPPGPGDQFSDRLWRELRFGAAVAAASASRAALVGLILLLFAVSGVFAQTSLGEPGNPSRSIRPVEDRPQAPEIAFKDRSGRDWGFVEFRGRPLIVTFWATWCPVCAHELPRLDRFQAELGPSGLKVIALSIDRAGVPVVDKFYAQRGIGHLNVYTDSEAILASVMGIAGVPTSFVIDTQGRIVGVAEGGVDWSAPDVQASLRQLLQ